MSPIEQKHLDRYALLERLHHQLAGSLHAHTDIMHLGLSLGFEPGYVQELATYLRVNGYIEFLGTTGHAMLTRIGLRLADREPLAA